MDLSDVLAFVEEADRGALLELSHPVSGEPTGLKLTLAGPDSRVQRASRLTMADELADLAAADGRVSAENREKSAIASLARCVLAWEISDDGKVLPLSHVNATRLLGVAWVREQIDTFAGNRANFAGGSR